MDTPLIKIMIDDVHIPPPESTKQYKRLERLIMDFNIYFSLSRQEIYQIFLALSRTCYKLHYIYNSVYSNQELNGRTSTRKILPKERLMILFKANGYITDTDVRRCFNNKDSDIKIYLKKRIIYYKMLKKELWELEWEKILNDYESSVFA